MSNPFEAPGSNGDGYKLPEHVKRAFAPLAVAASLGLWFVACLTPIQLFGWATGIALLGHWSTGYWRPVSQDPAVVLAFGLGRTFVRLMLDVIALISFVLFAVRLYAGTNL